MMNAIARRLLHRRIDDEPFYEIVDLLFVALGPGQNSTPPLMSGVRSVTVNCLKADSYTLSETFQ